MNGFAKVRLAILGVVGCLGLIVVGGFVLRVVVVLASESV